MQTPGELALTPDPLVLMPGAIQKQPEVAPTLEETLTPEVTLTPGGLLSTLRVTLTIGVPLTLGASLRQGVTLTLGDKLILGVRVQTTGHVVMLGHVQSRHSSAMYHNSRSLSNHAVMVQWQSRTMVVTWLQSMLKHPTTSTHHAAMPTLQTLRAKVMAHAIKVDQQLLEMLPTTKVL